MGRRVVQPLNQDAAAAADAAIAPDTGGRPLTCTREDARFRERWMDAYVANGGQVEEVRSPPVCGRRTADADDTQATVLVTPCPCAGTEILSETVVDTDPSHLPTGAYTATANEIILPRNRHRIGVGEEVVLTYTGGWAFWTITGEGRWSGHSPEVEGDTANGSTAAFCAGRGDGTIVVEALGLDGCRKSIEFVVVAPDSVTCFQVSGPIHNHQSVDAGTYINKRVGPSDVCFVNVSFQEHDALALATGLWMPTNGDSHLPPPEPPQTRRIGVVVPGTSIVKRIGGTYLRVSDLCHTGLNFDAEALARGISGRFVIEIPWKYGVGGEYPCVATSFSPVTQSVVTTNNLLTTGDCITTLERGGVRMTSGVPETSSVTNFTISCNYSDPSSNVKHNGDPVRFEGCLPYSPP